MSAIAEELLFRGLIFKGLKKHGKSFSIIATTIMFMLFHMAIDQAIYPLLMGLLLGVIMWKEDNIIYCIAVHMTNNIMSLTISYFNIPLSFNHWTFILMAILIVLAYLTAILFYTIKNGKGEETDFSELRLEYIIPYNYRLIDYFLKVMKRDKDDELFDNEDDVPSDLEDLKTNFDIQKAVDTGNNAQEDDYDF